jgi:hypothetical protein
VTFSNDGRTYGVNGLAKGSKSGYLALEAIWEEMPLPAVPPERQVSRLPVEERRRIFSALVQCELSAMERVTKDTSADQQGPDDFLARIARVRELQAACTAIVRQRERITIQEQEHLLVEGDTLWWSDSGGPPHPPRKSIGTLIQKGLALCGN